MTLKHWLKLATEGGSLEIKAGDTIKVGEDVSVGDSEVEEPTEEVKDEETKDEVKDEEKKSTNFRWNRFNIRSFGYQWRSCYYC